MGHEPTYSVIGMYPDGSEVILATGLSEEDASIMRDLRGIADPNLLDVRIEQQAASPPGPDSD